MPSQNVICKQEVIGSSPICSTSSNSEYYPIKNSAYGYHHLSVTDGNVDGNAAGFRRRTALNDDHPVHR